MGEVAARAGYQSEAAFSRAFKRVQGSSPGRLRRAKAEAGPTMEPMGLSGAGRASLPAH